MNIKKINLFIILVLCAFLLVNCGKDSSLFPSSGASSGSTGAGSVAFKIAPQQNKAGAKYISSNTQNLRFSITGEGLSSASVSTVPYSTATVTIENLPLGNKTAQIYALNSVNEVLSAGAVSFTVQAGKTASASVSLGVIITDSGFNPSTLSIPTNTTISFYNTSSQSHALVGSSPFTSASIPSGSSESITFTSSGSYIYYLDNSGSEIFGTVVASGASQWRQVTSPATNALESVWVSSSGKAYACGFGGAMAYYNGTSWAMVNSGTANYLWGINGVSDSDVYAVGNSRNTVHYNGSSWSLVYSGAWTLYGVWCASTSNVFAVGAGGTIVNYNGAVWSEMVSPTLNALYKAWGTSGSDIFAVGQVGTIVHYNGAVWSTMVSGIVDPAISLWSVWCASASNVFAVGDNGTILHYNGTAWSPMTSGTINPLYGVWGSSGSDVFAVGDNGTILHYDGSSWSAMTSPATGGLFGVGGNSSSNVYCVGALGTIFRYSN